jgi:hypothetical protein
MSTRNVYHIIAERERVVGGISLNMRFGLRFYPHLPGTAAFAFTLSILRDSRGSGAFQFYWIGTRGSCSVRSGSEKVEASSRVRWL